MTGFGPFGPSEHVAHQANPAESLARACADFADVRILPVTYDVGEGLDASDYDVVVAIGVAANRSEAKLEKVAINWAQATIEDNAGVLKSGEKLDPAGPDGVFSPVNVEQVAKHAGIGVSYSAGAYVCNSLAYSLYRSHPASVFLHIPPVLEDGPQIVRRIVEACLSA